MTTMRRVGLLLMLPTAILATTGCESTTALAEVNLVGTWDGVGSLQSSDEGRGITLRIQAHAGGKLSGTWVRSQSFLNQGDITGSVENNQISFRFAGFPGDDPTFDGRLTDQHRMSGTLDEVQLNGSAVFRRRSLDP